jgi:hypothetical protein
MSEEKLKGNRSLKKEGFTSPLTLQADDIKPKAVQNEAVKVDITDPTTELKQMLSQLIQSTQDNQARTRQELDDLKGALNAVINSNNQGSPQSLNLKTNNDTPPLDRSRENRRSSMFFGTPYKSLLQEESKSQIQVLQADIIYEKELNVSSLEGLQYFAKQLQLLSSKYPGREIRMAHMVAYNLRPHVLASWNSHCYKDSLITGLDPHEIMVEDWLTLSNATVQEILVEAARPRTKELYSRELVLFLGKGIPQTPIINAENFSKHFYAPLMKSLNDLLHLNDLLSADTTNHSDNKSKIPVIGYGTKESPGQIALWLIALGNQKDSIQQWLGKDNLSKYKQLEPAVKFIRSRLMEGRAQSEARQDFDSKLTPVRYEDLRNNQGDSHTRQQVSILPRQSFNTPSSNFRDRTRFNLSSIDTEPSADFMLHDVPTEKDDDLEDNYNDDDFYDLPAKTIKPLVYDFDHTEQDAYSLAALNDKQGARSAISMTFRGFCSELFVFGKCSRRDSGCSFDHSPAGQERCIQSFSLLSKRDLALHGQLPVVSSIKPDVKPGFQLNRQPVKSYGSQPPARNFGPPTTIRQYNK